MSRQELVEQLAQAAKRVEGWPEWKRTMFDRSVQAEQYFADRPQSVVAQTSDSSGPQSGGEQLSRRPL
jgi:hypothetical protein